MRWTGGSMRARGRSWPRRGRKWQICSSNSRLTLLRVEQSSKMIQGSNHALRSEKVSRVPEPT